VANLFVEQIVLGSYVVIKTFSHSRLYDLGERIRSVLTGPNKFYTHCIYKVTDDNWTRMVHLGS